MTSDEAPDPQDKIIVRVDADIEELIPGFLENRRKDVAWIQGALDRQDYEVIQVRGHQLKGMGGGYGFDAITEIGRSLEEAARKKNAEEIRRQIACLADYLHRVQVVYE
ncbi:MAG: Hpt domain-containing protein [Planctomycetes bacterium]|nr:Hpt domain-containing protein [Planctomycetota bacterium]